FSSSALSQIIRYYGHAMQGMMGSYLEKNIQVFIDIQNKLTENSKGLIDEKAFSPEMWTQFMSVQAPMMQGMMSNYIEQSKSLFMQMQEQMQSQAKNVFVGFPFPAMNGNGARPPGAENA
ncbi:MAG: PHB accumulation regulatory domain-containing protein, partial [Burkholderiaceae bacterium]